MTFDEAERALDAGKLEMMRPWGDWVPVRRRYKTIRLTTGKRRWRTIRVWMEGEVISQFSEAWDRFGQPGLRIAP